MNTKEAIKASIGMSQMISSGYLEDLSDQEMLHRPHPECNHIKWQLGHLIASENQMIDACIPGSMPKLPDGFAEKYSRESATSDDDNSFHSKSELMELFQQTRAATLAALEGCSDSDLDNPAPEALKSYAPDWGTAFVLQDSHWTMHAGQWAVIRRQLGRPPLF